MRITRLEKYRKHRRKKRIKLLLYTIIIPSVSIYLGYVLTTTFILPMIS